MFERVLPLIGENRLQKLHNSSVLVLGAGGVGCAVIEALARGGVGRVDVCDGDVYSTSNKNRQLYATDRTLGQSKALVACERIKTINADISATAYDFFYRGENMDKIDLASYDYVADCIDDVKAKCDLIERCKALGTPIIACMGTGNKFDVTKFKIADIKKTDTCPLAKAVRLELRARGIFDGVKVLYSTEIPAIKTATPASISYVPPAAGLMIAGEIIQDLIKEINNG